MRITHALLFLSLTALFSCSSDEDATTATELEPTTVNVTFTGLDISITPDLKANAPLRVSATESKVTRIAFKVFDATGIVKTRNTAPTTTSTMSSARSMSANTPLLLLPTKPSP